MTSNNIFLKNDNYTCQKVWYTRWCTWKRIFKEKLWLMFSTWCPCRNSSSFKRIGIKRKRINQMRRSASTSMWPAFFIIFWPRHLRPSIAMLKKKRLDKRNFAAILWSISRAACFNKTCLTLQWMSDMPMAVGLNQLVEVYVCFVIQLFICFFHRVFFFLLT